jgi:sigma-E factor negative regulatory protein RseC
MAVEIGTVKIVEGEKVLVEVEAGSGCGSCHAKGSCMMGSNGRTRSLWIKKNLDVHPGERVSFGIEGKGVVMASFLLYLFPVILLVAGMIAGGSYSDFLGMQEETASTVAGIAGIAVAFLIIRLVTPVLRKKRSFEPVLIDKCDQ